MKNRAVLFVDDDVFFLEKNIAIAGGSPERVDQLFSRCDVLEEPIRDENEVSTTLGSLKSGISSRKLSAPNLTLTEILEVYISGNRVVPYRQDKKEEGHD